MTKMKSKATETTGVNICLYFLAETRERFSEFWSQGRVFVGAKCPQKPFPVFHLFLNHESGFFGCFAPLKNPSLVVSNFASIEFGFFRALHAQINPFLVAFTRIIVGKFMLVGEEFFTARERFCFLGQIFTPAFLLSVRPSVCPS